MRNRPPVGNSHSSRHHLGHRLGIVFVNGQWASGLQRLGVTVTWARSAARPLSSPNSVTAISNSCPPQRSLVIFSEVLGLRALLKITRPQPNTIRQTIWSSSEKSTRLSNKAEQRVLQGEAQVGESRTGKESAVIVGARKEEMLENENESEGK